MTEAVQPPPRHGDACTGKTAIILRLPADAPPFIEGQATVGRHDGGHRHWVRFEGDPEWRLRVVHPLLQRDPEGLLAILLDVWRAERDALADFDDFFPGEHT